MPVSRDRRSHFNFLIDSLGYDFSNFQIQDFLNHLEIHRNRSLNVRYIPLAPELFGLWNPGKVVDYVFINSTLHPTHQIHCLLHEIAHILLGHRGMNLADLLGSEIFARLDLSTSEGHLRSSRLGDLVQEEEAEAFVLELQRRIVRADRLKELYGSSTSFSDMQPYARALDLEDRRNGRS